VAGADRALVALAVIRPHPAQLELQRQAAERGGTLRTARSPCWCRTASPACTWPTRSSSWTGAGSRDRRPRGAARPAGDLRGTVRPAGGGLPLPL